ncbi:leucyl/phenylalanyl-tRNA--protein transferase [Aliidiomarina sp.]|uniref:leucyl/phenylalanyl-tRNA--protein transferase n=1 Tax=Aliidiomarina sp. TaxID=1872439 RepID=UPI003A4D6966
MSFLSDLDHTSATAAFPPVTQALPEPDGLLAVGGCLSVPRLINAYQSGIFPWFSSNDPILWWSPSERAVIFPNQLHISKSLAKFIRKKPYRITLNMVFSSVIKQCATIPRGDPSNGVWITADMIRAYEQLHRAGHAHSIEIWHDDQLVGGLYGVLVGTVFCGESMFSKADNASKIALVAIRDYLVPYGLTLIDCQIPNPHLASLGAVTLPRKKFIGLLKSGLNGLEGMSVKGSTTLIGAQYMLARELN